MFILDKFLSSVFSVSGKVKPTKPILPVTKPTPGKSRFLLFFFFLHHHNSCKSLKKRFFKKMCKILLSSVQTAIRNLVAVYPLDATSGARDLSPTKNLPGKLSSVNIAPGPDGKPDTALRFSGSPNSYIEFPNNGRLDTRRSITCIAWVYNEGRGGPVFQYDPRGVGVGLRIIGLDRIEALIVSRNRRKKIPVVTRKRFFKPRTWTYVGFSYDFLSGIVTLYVNARPVLRRIIGRVQLLTNKPARAGSTRRGKRFFRGRLSCIQVYSRALTRREIIAVRKRCFKGGMIGETEIN